MSQRAGNADEKNDRLDEDLRVMAVADAVGALSKRDQQKLEYRETVAEPAERQAMWDVREGVMKQMRDDLPDVEPDVSLKHRVLARVLGAVESDLLNSAGGATAPLPMASAVKRGWIERFVGGKVSPIWRVAALVLMTVSVGLFWILSAANESNENLQKFARDHDMTQFSEEVGESSINFLIDPRAIHVAFAPLDGALAARALLAHFPDEASSEKTQNALFIASGLPELSSGEYFLCVDTPSVDNIVVKFASDGQIVGIGFDIPDDVDAELATWWVIKLDDNGDEVEVMQNIS